MLMTIAKKQQHQLPVTVPKNSHCVKGNQQVANDNSYRFRQYPGYMGSYYCGVITVLLKFYSNGVIMKLILS